jgi:hypothetical protein
MGRWICKLCLIICFAGATGTLRADSLIAFSLARAEDCLKSNCSTDVSQLSGITHLLGVVADGASRDLILIGEHRRFAAPLLAEDLAVALRAAFSPEDTAPLVSIDFADDTAVTGLQRVRMEGGIEDTRFGRDLLAADVVLKEIALGRRPTKVWGVQSYFDLSRSASLAANSGVRVRFWFKPAKTDVVAVRTNLAFIQEDGISVETGLVGTTGIAALPKTSGDPAADSFASSLNAETNTLATAYPEIARLRQLYTAVAAAEGLRALQARDQLSYWISRFPVRPVPTDRTFPVLRRQVATTAGQNVTIQEMEGGVDLKAFAIKLADGDVTALRDLVLLSRPKGNAIAWEVPAQAWQLPGGDRVIRGALQSQAEQIRSANSETVTPGFTLQRFTQLSSTAPERPQWTPISQPQIPPVSSMVFRPSVTAMAMPRLDRIGGVAIAGHYTISDASSDSAGTSTLVGLITGAAGSAPSEKAYRRMLTALWAVYLGDDRVGISLDPFQWRGTQGFGLGSHKVRYIGNVLNTDLARVMRETDYRMKRWVTGVEEPKLKSFRAAVRGYFEARRQCQVHGDSSTQTRFWFVPTRISLVRTESAVLFGDGSMTLRTECQGSCCGGAQVFADFVTQHYAELAATDPIFADLFEYAKLVALARYVKDQHVPLYWFLMANKQLIISEQSPELIGELTVRRTASVSTPEGTYIDRETLMGGVDLWAPLDVSSGVPVRDTSQSTDLAGSPVSAKSYSLLTRDPLTQHDDYRGLFYNTDLAIRDSRGGFLELVRYFSPEGRGSLFGRGWNLLLPYQLRLPNVDASSVHTDGISLLDLLNKREYALTPSSDRACVGCLVSVKSDAPFLRIAKTPQSGYRMIDRMGDEFAFEPHGNLTELTLGGRSKLTVEYAEKWATLSGELPQYKIVKGASDDGSPSAIDVFGLSGQSVYHFVHASERVAANGAFLSTGAASNDDVQLSWDHDVISVVKNGYRYVFGVNGQLNRVTDPSGAGLIAGISEGQIYIQFHYLLLPGGGPAVSRAELFVLGEQAPRSVAEYIYDSSGRLDDTNVQIGRAADAVQRQ